jgi:hypothetical protein
LRWPPGAVGAIQETVQAPRLAEAQSFSAHSAAILLIGQDLEIFRHNSGSNVKKRLVHIKGERWSTASVREPSEINPNELR